VLNALALKVCNAHQTAGISSKKKTFQHQQLKALDLL